jgi:hypothetical protein
VEQVLPELPAGNAFLEILVGGKNEAHIDADIVVAPHAPKGAASSAARSTKFIVPSKKPTSARATR